MWIKIYLKKGQSVETNPISMTRLKSGSERIGTDKIPGHQIAVGYLIKYHLRLTFCNGLCSSCLYTMV